MEDEFQENVGEFIIIDCYLKNSFSVCVRRFMSTLIVLNYQLCYIICLLLIHVDCLLGMNVSLTLTMVSFNNTIIVLCDTEVTLLYSQQLVYKFELDCYR